MKCALRGLVAMAALVAVSPARAQDGAEAPPPAPSHVSDAIESEARDVESLHRESLTTRRALAKSVLVTGIVSVAAGAALIIPDAEDQGFRYAGINTAIFGAVNTAVALIALHGIAREQQSWESSAAAAARRAPGGAARARAHAAFDERREATSHAINLGLGAAYLAVAGVTILASRSGVDHPNRWLGSGIAIAAQAVFLVGLDYVGFRRASSYHRRFVDGLTPSVAVIPSTPSSPSTETRIGFSGTF